MPDVVNNTPTKLISLGNLETYTGYIEPKQVVLNYAQYLALPESEKNSGKTFYIPDLNVAPATLNSLIFTMRQTLTAGSTSLTFTNANLSENSLIEIFYPNTADPDFNYTDFTQNSSTSFTLTFEAQSSDIQVVALVFNV